MEGTKQPPKVKAVYQAVIALFAEGADLNSLTVAEIAEKAGIGKGTVYEYFKNNEYIKYFYIVIASLFLFGLFCDAATLFLRFDTDISVKNPKLFYNVFYTVQFWF